MLKLLILAFIAGAFWHVFRGGLRHDYKDMEKRGWEDIERLRERKREEKRRIKLAKSKK